MSSNGNDLRKKADHEGGGIASVTWMGLLRSAVAVAITGLTVWSTSAMAAESLSALDTRIKIDAMSSGLKHGDSSSLAALPVKGYKDGMAGFMRQFQLYPNPKYSFTTCDEDVLSTATGGKPGCIVSIKLARKNVDGTYQDTGIRMEYGVAPGSKRFLPNNSAYAEHAVNGDGLLQAQFN